MAGPKKRFLRALGPGLVTGAADLDPSAIATYSQAGAQFGFGLLWMPFYMYPLIAAVQELCARIGAVTGKGIVANIREHFGRGPLYFFVLVICAANVITLGADIGAMAAAAQLLMPVRFHFLLLFFTAVILFLQIRLSYIVYSRVLRLFALALLAYPLTAVVVSNAWGEIFLFSLLPRINTDPGFLYLMTGILGAGISPYMYLWQASQEVEEEKALGCVSEEGSIERPVRPPYISRIRWDTALGMLASLFSAWCIVVVAQSVFHRGGVFEIRTAADAARALEPLVSAFPHSGLIARSIFAAGIIGLGLLAVPVMAGSAAYATAEIFNWRQGLAMRFGRARGFYAVIVAATLIGFALNLFEFNPIEALVFASVVNGMSTGPLLLLIYLIGRNGKIMGRYRSGPVSAALMALSILAAFASAVALLFAMAAK